MSFGPRQIDTFSVAARALAAGGGALAGGILLGLIYLFLGAGIFLGGTNSALVFFPVASLALTMTGNLGAVAAISSVDREKFLLDRAGHFRRVFAVNFLLFFLAVVCYFWAVVFAPSFFLAFFAGHLALGILFSSLALEGLASRKAGLAAVLGAVLGIFLTMIALALLWKTTLGLFLTLALPAGWFSLALAVGLVEAGMAQLYEVYGVEFFPSQPREIEEEDSSPSW
jgi:hypothetical protein